MIQSDVYWNRRRAKYPGRGLAMDYDRSRTTAIEEKYRDCMQEADCSECTSPACPLYPFRPGAERVNNRVAGEHVPTREEYEQAIEKQRLERDPDGSKAEALRTRINAMHEAKRGQFDELGELV